jgi:hypothetical protein
LLSLGGAAVYESDACESAFAAVRAGAQGAAPAATFILRKASCSPFTRTPGCRNDPGVTVLAPSSPDASANTSPPPSPGPLSSSPEEASSLDPEDIAPLPLLLELLLKPALDPDDEPPPSSVVADEPKGVGFEEQAPSARSADAPQPGAIVASAFARQGRRNQVRRIRRCACNARAKRKKVGSATEGDWSR